MMRVVDIPIRVKLLTAIVGTTVLCLIVTASVFLVSNWFSVRTTLANNLTAVAEVFTMNTAAALSFNDARAANEILSSLQAKREVVQACLYRVEADGEESLFARYGSSLKDMTLRCPQVPPEEGFYTTNHLVVVSPVSLGDDRIGSVYIERRLNDLWESIRLEAMIVGLMVLVSIAIAIMLSLRVQKLISNPILALLGATKAVSDSSDYSIRAIPTGNDEIGGLISGFNNMLAQIESRDIDLAATRTELELRIEQADKANNELELALVELKETQDQLVNNEKMASLGGLVAGVAHEINTPVGVGVTAASTLREDTKATFTLYETGALTNSSLKHYFSICMQATEIILGNLQRAADLIHSFKQVAVDQTSTEYRTFELKRYIEETLLSLKPKLRCTELNVVVKCDSDLTIHSAPGAMSQIITNLVMNSIQHAYEEAEPGCLHILAEEQVDNIHIHYSDDGKGMPADVLKKVFEPFFTTRRGSGGSGLGMHILFNLVTQQLKGVVTLRSTLGEGSSVDIVFPKNVPLT
jgi:two-component system NtrC family sensor kinase